MRIEDKIADVKDELRELSKNGKPVEPSSNVEMPKAMSQAIERLSNFEAMIRDYIKDMTNKFTSILKAFSDKPDFDISDPALFGHMPIFIPKPTKK